MKLKQLFSTLFLLLVLLILVAVPINANAATDVGNAPASAAIILINSPVAQIIEIANDIDYYKFDAVAGTTYIINASVTTLDWANLYLYNTDGTTLIKSDDDPFDTAPVILWTCGSSGTYYVKIAGFFSTWGTYTLTVSAPADDHPNAYNFANAVTVDNVSDTDGNIQYIDDDDYFQFDATAGTAYVLTETPGLLYDSDLHLFDTDGVTELHSKFEYSAGTAIITWVCKRSGTYYVSVGGDSGDYTFSVKTTTVTDDIGNDAANSDTITVDSAPSPGNIQYANDDDYFKFDATAGTIYNMITTSTTLIYSNTHFLDTDGTTEITSVFGGSGNPSSIAWTCPANGTYYLNVVGKSNADTQFWTGTYTISVETVTDDIANDIAGAEPITVGGASIPGDIQYMGDQDFFTFTATAGTIYTITATIGTLPSAGIWILDSTGRILNNLKFNPSVWECPTSGTYYFIVEAYTFGNTGTYSASVTSGGVVDDHANDYTLAYFSDRPPHAKYSRFR
jgi:hypothetical protein